MLGLKARATTAQLRESGVLRPLCRTVAGRSVNAAKVRMKFQILRIAPGLALASLLLCQLRLWFLLTDTRSVPEETGYLGIFAPAVPPSRGALLTLSHQVSMRAFW